MEASQVKVHDIPNLTCFSRGHVASLQQQRRFALCAWSFHPQGRDGLLSSLARVSRMA